MRLALNAATAAWAGASGREDPSAAGSRAASGTHEAGGARLDPNAPIGPQRAALRAFIDASFARIDPGIPDGVAFEEAALDSGVPVLVCRPLDVDAGAPLLLYVHGGGFWQGSAFDPLDRVLVAQRVAELGCVAVGVDYRLAPESVFPAALDDIAEAVRWIGARAGELGVDAARIVLDGVSAGASIALSTAMRAAAVGESVCAGLLLEVPIGDMREDGMWLGEYAELNGLEDLRVMHRMYAGPTPLDDPLLSPVLAPSFEGLPPVRILTAEYDPLRAGGEELARRMCVAGIDVAASRHLGALHGSSGLVGTEPVSRAWHEDACAALAGLMRRR